MGPLGAGVERSPVKSRYRIRTIHIGLAAEPGAKYASSPAEAAVVLRAIIDTQDADQEHFVLLALSNQNRLNGFKVVASGAMSACLVDPRIVYRVALLLGSSAIIVGHNHSSSLEPSREDIALSRKLKAGGDLLDLPLKDSLVLTPDGRYTSLLERGVI
jgi:DNA repair protein RadC